MSHLAKWLSVRLQTKWLRVRIPLLLISFDYKIRNDHKIFHSSFKLIPSDSDINEEFKFMDQSIMTKIRNYARKDWIVLDIIEKHIIKIFEC